MRPWDGERRAGQPAASLVRHKFTTFKKIGVRCDVSVRCHLAAGAETHWLSGTHRDLHMIIKTADDHGRRHRHPLEQLARHPGASAAIRKKIEIEIRCIKAGARGTRSRRPPTRSTGHFGDGTDFAVIHDLRIVVGEQVAQIDHLIVNRSLAAFLCETKNFSDGLGCNEHGEWVGFRNGKPSRYRLAAAPGKAAIADILQSLLPAAASLATRSDWAI